MIEREKKLLLTREEYNFLLAQLPEGAITTTQINHYYDTENGTLNALGITYRVREVNGTFTTTIKSHKPIGEKSIERSHSIIKQPDTVSFGHMQLFYQGHLSTQRTMFSPCEGLCVFIDKNTYLNTTDYELEVEYTKTTTRFARTYLKNVADTFVSHQLIASPADLTRRVGKGKSKSQRFFTKKRKRID